MPTVSYLFTCESKLLKRQILFGYYTEIIRNNGSLIVE